MPNSDRVILLGGRRRGGPSTAPELRSLGRVYEDCPNVLAGSAIKIVNPYSPKAGVYKGQLHCHSTNSDGVDAPAAVVSAYLASGYDFVSITDHAFLTPDPGVGGLYILGVEENAQSAHVGHIGASSVLGTSQPPQHLIDSIAAQSDGISILNHPNYPGANWSDDEVDSVSGYHAIEIWNATVPPDENSEDVWDALLSKFRKAWGVSIDDCHDVAGSAFNKGAVHVFADSLTSDDILDSIRRGNFYSTYKPAGQAELLISSIGVSGSVVSASVSELATIEFVGRGGVVLQTTLAVLAASYSIAGDEIYVRVRATAAGGSMAWSNPFYAERLGNDVQKSGVVDGRLSVYDKLTIIGASDMDAPTYEGELLDADNWTSAGWTGGWTAGWAHTTGNTSALSHDHAAVVSAKYQITYTVSGRTAGTFTLAFGGQPKAGISASGAFGPTATTADALTITPTTDFDGTVVVSITKITGMSTAAFAIYNSVGSLKFEIRENSGGLYNTFVGQGCGAYTTTGDYNTGLGLNALYRNTTGWSNTGLGLNALTYNTVGYYNTAVGVSALSQNTAGYNNTAVGYLALYSSTISYNNTAVGLNSLYAITTGNHNTGVGYEAGRYYGSGTGANQTSSLSVYLGMHTRAGADGNTNEIVIGYNAVGGGSNTVTLGHTTITTTFLRGNVGVGMTPSYALDVTGAGRFSAGFGCNGKTPQTAYSANAACSDLATVIALCNQLRAALVANGICV